VFHELVKFRKLSEATPTAPPGLMVSRRDNVALETTQRR